VTSGLLGATAIRDGVVASATPYPWPYHGGLDPTRTALVACVDPSWRRPGTDADRADDALGALALALHRCGGRVVAVTDTPVRRRYTAQWGHGPFVADAPELEPLLAPDVRIVAGATSAFYASSLEDELRAAGVRDLIVAGWGLEGPVHSTLRDANDRGFECLLVPEASCPLDPELVFAASDMVRHSGGIFGAFASTHDVLAARRAGRRRSTPMSAVSPSSQPAIGLQLDAEPYPWPYDGVLRPESTALVLIDWQVDFCGPGGYVDRMGYDLSLTRAGLEPTARVLAAVRAWGGMVIHTREGHRPDLTDCPPNKLWRSQRIGAGIGDAGPAGRILVRGEPGWEIVPEVAPIAGETIIDKPGKGAFYATDLDLLLRTRGITHIVLTGITTDVCVHTTMRDANDRGYECLLLTDCTGATDYGNYEAALKMVTMQGGVFGAIAPSSAFVAAISAPVEATIS
jgi:nicotinamidase-related amidase